MIRFFSEAIFLRSAASFARVLLACFFRAFFRAPDAFRAFLSSFFVCPEYLEACLVTLLNWPLSWAIFYFRRLIATCSVT